MKRYCGAAVALVLSGVCVFPAPAVEIPRDRPSERAAPLPADEPAALPPVLDLPPLPPAAHPVPMAVRIQVNAFRFVGNTAISDEALTTIVAPYTGRDIDTAELETIRIALTRYYVERGYINSGAVLPDQDVTGGVVRFQIVEGRLTQIEVRGNKRLPESYIRERLALAAGPPMSVYEIRDRLFLLQQDPHLQRVNAALLPGARPGEAALRVDVEEAPNRRAYVTVNNYRPPSVGEGHAELEFVDTNLLGFGDSLGLRHGWTVGSEDIDLIYAMPLSPRDTALQLRYTKGNSKVMETSFDELSAKSESQTISVGLWVYPHKTPQQELGLGVAFEQRKSYSSLLDDPFAFSLGTPPSARLRLSVLRFGQSWTSQAPARVISVRSTFSLGVNALNPTFDYIDAPPARFGDLDARFLSWLGQLQWVERLFARRDEWVVRIDTQQTNGPLLSLEQFSVGGARSVRGYRENQLVRDYGLLASAEYRWTLWSNSGRGHRVQLAGFYDWGGAWNRERETPEPMVLASAGVGMRANYSTRLEFEIYYGKQLKFEPYYGKQLKPVEKLGHDYQDHGIHAQLRVRLW